MNKKYELDYKNKKNDCEVVGDDIINVFSDIGECFETVVDEKKKTSSIFGNLFNVAKSTTKLVWDVGSCTVKHTPKAIVAIAEIKRDISDGIVKIHNEIEKEKLEAEFDEKIKKIKKEN